MTTAEFNVQIAIARALHINVRDNNKDIQNLVANEAVYRAPLSAAYLEAIRDASTLAPGLLQALLREYSQIGSVPLAQLTGFAPRGF